MMAGSKRPVMSAQVDAGASAHRSGGAVLRRLWRGLLGLYPFALVIAAWFAMTEWGGARPMFLPSPMAVARQFLALLSSQEVVQPVLLSLYRAFLGLLLAVAAGIALGLGMARIRWFRRVLDPLVAVAFPAPKIAFMPIFILWFGIDSLSKVLLVAFTCVFPMIIAAYEGAISVPPVMLWSARAMGATPRRVLWRVVLPAAVPAIFSGIRVTVPVALITAYTAEMVAGGGGLGAVLMYAQRFFETPTVFVCIVLMLLSGVVLDRGLVALRARIIPWQDEQDD
ncbi:ABC transmembrane type-1 domain-containing protein [Bordetella sputigena]|uniref:ABC transporter permease n=1 Tax=Bordetella sputigena TaxID=1416810 RepID=UPI0039EEE9AE